MGSQRVVHDWVTELNWTMWKHSYFSTSSPKLTFLYVCVCIILRSMRYYLILILICISLCLESESHSFMSNSLRPHGLYSPWNSPGKNTEVGSLSLRGDLPNPGVEPRSPTLQVDSLPAEPQGKPKNTGMGRLSLFQQIFLTQKLNWDLPQCRWILYQLSYQGSLSNHRNKKSRDLQDSFL